MSGIELQNCANPTLDDWDAFAVYKNQNTVSSVVSKNYEFKIKIIAATVFSHALTCTGALIANRFDWQHAHNYNVACAMVSGAWLGLAHLIAY